MLSALSEGTTLYIHGFQAMPGDTAQLILSLSSTEKISSFEADLTLPKGMTVIETSLGESEETTNHIIRTRYGNSEQNLHIGCWSPTNAPLTNRILLSVAINKNTPKGSYLLSMTKVLLVTPDGASQSSDGNTAVVEINDDGHSPNYAAFFSDTPVSQAWYLKNADTGYYMHLNSISQKITQEKLDVKSKHQQFFLEPAYELEEGLFYLRNVEGFYLCCTPNASSYDLSISNQPNATSAFFLAETGDRTYSLSVAESEKRLASSEMSASQELRISQSNSLFHWQFFMAEASHSTYLERLYTTSAHCMGLTQGMADFNLRNLRHILRLAMDEGIDDKQAAASIDRLNEAVSLARRAYAKGDTSVVETHWLAAEKFSSIDRVITTVDANGKTLFLSLTDGGFGLSDSFAIITSDTSEYILQDAFYNPYTDGYALRLSGSEIDYSGTYLTANALTGVLSDTTVTSLTESMGQWTVLSLSQAVQRYLTLSGKSGTNVNWDFDLATGTLTFNGLLRTNTYNKLESRPWHIYRHLIRHVVFAGKISLLGANLLADCTNIEDITFISNIKPTAGEGAFDGIPDGIDIYALNPEAFEDYLPGCRTHFLVQIQQTYEYDGTSQTPIVEGPYEAAVTEGRLQKDAGTYTSTFTITISIDGKTYDYSGPITYTILPAPLTISTRDYSRIYGSKNPLFVITINGLKGEDTEKSEFITKPITTCEADEKSPVGSYPIYISGATLANENYEIQYEHATLTIRPKRLLISADDTVRYVGEANPPFTYTCVGLIDGEDESVLIEKPILSCEADSTSPPGKYPIIVSGGSAVNYTTTYANGILTIMERTGIKGNCQDEKSHQNVIYNLQGQRIKATEPSEKFLPPGVYIINGKKIKIK
ncbi:MAG: hypothetical protein J6Y84_03010 [Bacteroidaceae bacterium]|nr:hypothetical protein [Bacteroidaceae bacterium]